MTAGSKNMEERLSSLASDMYESIQQQLKENEERILKCAESNCPFLTGQQVETPTPYRRPQGPSCLLEFL